MLGFVVSHLVAEKKSFCKASCNRTVILAIVDYKRDFFQHTTS